MNGAIVYEYDIVNEFDEYYRQASSGIEGLRMFDHTINWTFGMPSSEHTGRDTAVCLSRVKDTALGHGRVPRPCEVCT
ncbi:hypothetical protein F383_17627 [Gossypium arboreum]|uniref:Uncharacterized protein n=1 Tax=Gossypium arboreum TaxID=29729 RepID=A0A0B0NKH7_GOSAR|nr:hypothetical protein F383_17627 [Gossypium arboreum]